MNSHFTPHSHIYLLLRTFLFHDSAWPPFPFHLLIIVAVCRAKQQLHIRNIWLQICNFPLISITSDTISATLYLQWATQMQQAPLSGAPITYESFFILTEPSSLKLQPMKSRTPWSSLGNESHTSGKSVPFDTVPDDMGEVPTVPIPASSAPTSFIPCTCITSRMAQILLNGSDGVRDSKQINPIPWKGMWIILVIST